MVEMASQSSFVSILNNDDNPSFAVRSTPRLTRHHSSSSSHASISTSERPLDQQQRLAAPSDYPYPFDPVAEAARAPSPGSSDCSRDYAPSSCGSYQPNPSDSFAYPSSATSTGVPSETRRSPADPPSPQTSSVSGSKESSSSVSKRDIRKNKYPCPYASSHGCASTFTTSGHAARHGKKHTGEKSVHCPICSKAFTRKDNMKQHIRTHRTHSEDMNGGERDGSKSTWTRRRNLSTIQHNRSISQTSRQMPY